MSTALMGVGRGTWQQGTAERAHCALCGCWVIRGIVWRYWVGLVATKTVCEHCAEGGSHD